MPPANPIAAVFFWLGERIRDLAMWPVNLVRDFPARFGRLAETLVTGGRGILLFLPHMGAAAGQGQLRPWLRHSAGRAADWFHRLLTQLFDLAGGPEVGEFLIHLVSYPTPLTGEEIAQVSAVLGPSAIRYGEVRVVQGGLFDLIFKLNGNLAFATWHSINIPKNGRHNRDNRSILVHELTHVFQYERVGTRYLGEAVYMLIKTKRNCYNYGSAAGLADACRNGRHYADYNREQQAQITQDYYTLSQGGRDVTAYEPFIAQVRLGQF